MDDKQVWLLTERQSGTIMPSNPPSNLYKASKVDDSKHFWAIMWSRPYSSFNNQLVKRMLCPSIICLGHMATSRI